MIKNFDIYQRYFLSYNHRGKLCLCTLMMAINMPLSICHMPSHQFPSFVTKSLFNAVVLLLYKCQSKSTLSGALTGLPVHRF